MSHKRARLPKSADTLRLVGGRRRYNEVRQLRALNRRSLVLARLVESEGGWLAHGWAANLAKELGVSAATISRDVAALGFRRPPRRRASRLSRFVGVPGLSPAEEQEALDFYAELLTENPAALTAEQKRKLRQAVEELAAR